MTNDFKQSSKSLVVSLSKTLNSISQNPFPHIEDRDECLRRASVAIIIRIRPHFSYRSEDETSGPVYIHPCDLNEFFTLPWVQEGDPEIAFIKRAARVGDRWTGHIALPGGKRDPGDFDDRSVAVRETAEEIGLNLTSSDAIYVGNLSERLVRTAWGTIPMMMLCPFIFLWTKPVMPPLRLQPGEVASVHWVPLRTLLSPYSHTYKYVDISDRFTRRGGPVCNFSLRLILGLMRFSAIRLSPSESLHCSSTDEFFPKKNITGTNLRIPVLSRILGLNLSKRKSHSMGDEPLLLWGLTLGILVDFLNQLPPHNAIELWSYPTFTNYDVRFVISVLTLPLRRRNKDLLRAKTNIADPKIADIKVENIPTKDTLDTSEGLYNCLDSLHKVKSKNLSCAVGFMLDGYYDMIRKGAIIAVGLRAFGTFLLLLIILRRYKKKLP